MNRVLVYGGRDYADRGHAFEVLDTILTAAEGDFVVVHGGADGADAIAGEYARARALPYWVFPADWANHGRSAGPRRNARMLDVSKPDMAVQFPGGKGTADMRRRLIAAGVGIVEA